jgi:hypothetical protein
MTNALYFPKMLAIAYQSTRWYKTQDEDMNLHSKKKDLSVIVFMVRMTLKS